jgi:hypothetical protein
MVPHVTRFFLSVSALALMAMPVAAQRPALTGEKAQVADAVKADLSRLSDLQTAHHNRTRVYAADARDLNFTPTSGATINIAYASMNAWAANATHPTLSPVACFIIISSAEPTGPAAQPFCQEGRPGSTTVASGQPSTGGTPRTAPSTTPNAPAAAPATTPSPAPTTQTPSQPSRTGTLPGGAPATVPVPTPSIPTVTPSPSQPARDPQPRTEPATPAATPRPETGMSPVQPAQPLRQPGAIQQTGGPTIRPQQPTALPYSDIPASARAGTRDIDPAGMTVPTATENVTPAQFSAKLNEFAQGATTLLAQIPADLERIVRDPYESTAEFQARRAAALEAAQRKEREFFQQNSKTYNVAVPVREVRYDPDREIFEFTVDGMGLPITRGEGNAPGTLTFTCYSRPVFWCSSEVGMTYEAGDMWRIPRATARQFDILRTPLTLYARFAVGRRNDASVLAIALVSMDLQARGQSVSRWDGTSR